MEVPMHTMLKSLLAVAGIVVATQAGAQITFYEGEGFRGRAFTADGTLWNFEPSGFNDRAASVAVQSGTWQVCEDAQFRGRCAILRPGNYPSLDRVGLDRRISSVRPVEETGQYQEPAPPPAYDARPRQGQYQEPAQPAYDARPRQGEAFYQVPARAALLGGARAGRRKSRRRERPRRDCRRHHRRGSRPPDRRRTWKGHRHSRRGCRRSRGGCEHGTRRERCLRPGRATLPERAEFSAAGLLGRELQLPGYRAPRAIERTSGPDDYRQ